MECENSKIAFTDLSNLIFMQPIFSCWTFIVLDQLAIDSKAPYHLDGKSLIR